MEALDADQLQHDHLPGLWISPPRESPKAVPDGRHLGYNVDSHMDLGFP